MISETWKMLKNTILAFIEDEALSRGAAIAFYTVTSIAPVLLIVIAVAGLAFGRDAAQNAITTQLTGLMGQQTAEVIQSAIASASQTSSGLWATIIGIATLILTASGVFGEMQTALNAIWKAKPQGTTVSRLIRARAASLGLVATLGFLLMVSLVVSTGLTAFGDYLDSLLPFGKAVLTVLNGLVSILLISLLFAAIYKVLPDRKIEWRDVAVGALVTAILFTIGKSLISWYLGSSAVSSSFGAAGGLIVLLLWVYYSAQIFLMGAEFTKVFLSGTVASKPRLMARYKPSASIDPACSTSTALDRYERRVDPISHSRQTVNSAAIKTGPRKRPTRPNDARPPKTPTSANRKGSRAAPPTSAGQTKWSPINMIAAPHPKTATAAQALPPASTSVAAAAVKAAHAPKGNIANAMVRNVNSTALGNAGDTITDSDQEPFRESDDNCAVHCPARRRDHLACEPLAGIAKNTICGVQHTSGDPGSVAQHNEQRNQ